MLPVAYWAREASKRTNSRGGEHANVVLHGDGWASLRLQALVVVVVTVLLLLVQLIGFLAVPLTCSMYDMQLAACGNLSCWNPLWWFGRVHHHTCALAIAILAICVVVGSQSPTCLVRIFINPGGLVSAHQLPPLLVMSRYGCEWKAQ